MKSRLFISFEVLGSPVQIKICRNFEVASASEAKSQRSAYNPEIRVQARNYRPYQRSAYKPEIIVHTNDRRTNQKSAYKPEIVVHTNDRRTNQKLSSILMIGVQTKNCCPCQRSAYKSKVVVRTNDRRTNQKLSSMPMIGIHPNYSLGVSEYVSITPVLCRSLRNFREWNS